MAQVFLSSCLGLLLEVQYTRVLSLVYSPFFVYMVIGVALLGIGASGVVLALVFRFVTGFSRRILAGSWLGFGLSAAIPLAALSVFVDRPVFHRGLAVVLAAPFFFVGVIAAVAYSQSTRTHRVYLAGTLGSVLGVVAGQLGMSRLGSTGLIVATAGAGLMCAALVLPARASRFAALGVGLLALGLAPCVRQVALPCQSFKLIAASRALPNFKEEYVGWDSVARIDVYSIGRVFRAGPKDVPFKILTQDYSAPSLYLGLGDGPDDRAFSDGRIESMAYWLRPAPEKALVIGLGGGPDIQAALHGGAMQVTAVDINATVVDLLRGRFDEFLGGVGRNPRVALVHEDGGRFLRVSGDLYDTIQMSGVDTDVATLGGTARIAENYLYTREAIRQIYRRLKPGGLAGLSWADYSAFLPVKERIFLTALEALEAEGVPAAELNLMVGRAASRFTLLIKKGAFDAWETERVRDRLKQPMSADWPALETMQTGRPTKYEQGISYVPGTTEESFFTVAVRRFHDFRDRQWAGITKSYDLSPTSNDRPFFFIMDKTGGSEHNLAQLWGNIRFTGLLALAVLVVPAFARRRVGDNRLAPEATFVLGYALLGGAFICVEVVFLQKFVYVLGYPALSVVTVLCGLLVSMGTGSVAVGKVRRSPLKALLWSGLALGLLLSIYDQVFWRVAGRVDSWPLWGRVAASVALIAPIGFIMGIPFPTGIRAARERMQRAVPWALGANGAANAVGAFIALLACWTLGFRLTLQLAGWLYALAGIVLFAVCQRSEGHDE